jgi:hypothetical protein
MKFILVQDNVNWLRLTTYETKTVEKDGKKIILLIPYLETSFSIFEVKTQVFKKYIHAIFKSLLPLVRDIIEMDEELSILVEAMFDIDDKEKEIWEKANNLASDPKLLIHYLHNILLARKLGRNENVSQT